MNQQPAIELNPVVSELASALTLRQGAARIPREKIAYFVAALRRERSPQEACAHVIVLARRFEKRSPATARHLLAIVIMTLGFQDAQQILERTGVNKSETEKALASAIKMNTKAIMDKPKMAAVGASMRRK